MAHRKEVLSSSVIREIKVMGDERFRPDMLKIYPTLVVKNTALYKYWKEGKYICRGGKLQGMS